MNITETPTTFVHAAEDYHEFQLVKSIMKKVKLDYQFVEVGMEDGKYIALFWTGEKPVTKIQSLKEEYGVC